MVFLHQPWTASSFPDLLGEGRTDGFDTELSAVNDKRRRAARLLAGVDACTGGWLYVRMDLPSGSIDCGVAGEFARLLEHRPRFDLVAVDIPIGLADAGPRECDRAARRFLGEPRGRSVFRAPIRPALHARTREEADRITRRIDGAGVSAHAYGIVPKIEEVDALLSIRRLLQRRIKEVHPEVSFAFMNGERPLADSKKTPKGVHLRARLIKAWLGSSWPQLAAALPKSGWKPDDLLDACAALWTALRIRKGVARRFPLQPPSDRCGLRMEINA